MEEDQSTPIPGKALSREEAEWWNAKLKELFRPKGRDPFCHKLPIASNIPTACLLEGDTVDSEYSNLPLEKDLPIIILFEGSPAVDAYETTVGELLAFLDARQPWEDYDICVLDRTMLWCFGISHEDRVTFARRIPAK